MAEFIDRRGNIFLTDCQVITVTVNCEGVMGAGIAHEAKLRWPLMFDAYSTKCSVGELAPGELLVWPGPDAEETRRILCFPTKTTWRQPSRLSYITAGLQQLASQYDDWGVRSIAMPHLGCSKGGLSWSAVRPQITQVLQGCSDLRVELWDFDPAAADPNFDHLVRTIASYDDRAIAELFGLRHAQATALRAAVEDEDVTGLAVLAGARKIGESTLQKVYDYLFSSPSRRPERQSLF